jgi:capsular polysaccharide biosynthesis protein
MELKEIKKTLSKNKFLLVISAFIGLALGVVLYYSPTKYISTGSFYVGREIDKSDEFFSYEGYYAQQTAVMYTNSVMSLAESFDVKKSALDDMGLPYNNKNVRILERALKIKKSGPQTITISTKHFDKDTSESMFRSISKSLVKISENLNKSGDNSLFIQQVSTEPLVKEVYKSFYIYSFVGLLSGLIVGLFYLCLREYFKD